MTDRSNHQLIETTVEMTPTKTVKGILKKPTNYLMRAGRSSSGSPFIIQKRVTF